jgi:hypothetical protein
LIADSTLACKRFIVVKTTILRAMARPKNVGETDELRLTLPVSLINYLNYLAKDSVMGPNANDIAAHLLIESVRALIREKEHEMKLPSLDLTPPVASTRATGG